MFECDDSQIDKARKTPEASTIRKRDVSLVHFIWKSEHGRVLPSAERPTIHPLLRVREDDCTAAERRIAIRPLPRDRKLFHERSTYRIKT
jgi:hypothetical protein